MNWNKYITLLGLDSCYSHSHVLSLKFPCESTCASKTPTLLLRNSNIPSELVWKKSRYAMSRDQRHRTSQFLRECMLLFPHLECLYSLTDSMKYSFRWWAGHICQHFIYLNALQSTARWYTCLYCWTLHTNNILVRNFTFSLSD
jgi:hypothetical protein